MIGLESAMEIVYNKYRLFEAKESCFHPDCCFVDAYFNQITVWRETCAYKGWNYPEDAEDRWSPYVPIQRAFQSVLPKHVKVIVYGHDKKDRPPRIVMGTYGEME